MRWRNSWLAVAVALMCLQCGDDSFGCERLDDWRKRDKRRDCIDHEECFGGEYCDASGHCAPYDGRTDTEPRPDPDDD